MKIFISGQKYFGERVFMDALNAGHEVVAVSAPLGDAYLAKAAVLAGVPVIPSGTLTPVNMPGGVDLGVCAHSFDYISRRLRYSTRLGWIGFHPSLLPRHRGKSAIEWALRMRDFATGGTVFWLSSGIDRGDIERQEIVWIDPALTVGDIRRNAASLWRSDIMPLGTRLMRAALLDISRGVINRTPQDGRFSTFEPSTEVRDIYKPDALCISWAGAQDAA